jgi:hypothetical protein
MMPKSGFRSIRRWKWITESGEKNRQIPIAAARDGADRGAERSESRDEDHVEQDRQRRHRRAEAERRTRVARRAKGSREEEEQHHAEDAEEHRPEERERQVLHLGRGVDDAQKGRRREVAGRRHQRRHPDRRQEGLVDDAVDLLGLVGAGEARHEHAHPGEERADEDDDDDDDLPAHADGRVGGVADVVAHHHVVDDPLQPGDDVL